MSTTTAPVSPRAGTPTPATYTSPEEIRETAGAKAFNRLAATCLVLFALIWLVPFLWALFTSARPDGEITARPVTLHSHAWSLNSYRSTVDSHPVGWWYLNSVIISTLSVVLTVVVCSMIAFALVHLRFRGRSALLALVLAGVMLPTEALVLPQFMEFRSLHLLGTYWAVILPSIAAPVAVFVFHAFMRSVPSALVDAARIDGAGWWRTYSQIVMPQCRPAIAAVAILTFIQTWNAFLWPLLVLTQTKSETVTVGLSSLVGGAAIQYAETMAGAALGFLPLIGLFLLLQRQIVQGVASTGIR